MREQEPGVRSQEPEGELLPAGAADPARAEGTPAAAPQPAEAGLGGAVPHLGDPSLAAAPPLAEAGSRGAVPPPRDPSPTGRASLAASPPEEGGLPVSPASAEGTAPAAPLRDEGTPPERYPFWNYSDLLLFIALILPSLLIGMGAMKGILLLFHLHLISAAELISEQFAGYAVLFCVLAVMFKVQYGRPFWPSLAWNPMRSPAGILACGMVTAFLTSLLGYLIRTPTTDNPMTKLLHDRASIIVVASFGVTWGPLAEELAFRGFLQPLLVRSFGPLIGILGAAIPFGILHFWEYGNSWRHAVLIAAAGAAFGWMRHATGSTKASTLMHAGYNALGFIALLIQGRS